MLIEYTQNGLLTVWVSRLGNLLLGITYKAHFH